MSAITWQTQYSVETSASAEFAWAYMTNVANWDDPPAQFRFEGPFITGARGATDMPGQPSRVWQLRLVNPIEFYTIEAPLDGAVLSFTWRFTALAADRTRLTQEIVLEGENAAAYATGVEQVFGPTLGPGMNRIAEKLGHAYATAQHRAAEA